MEMRIFVIPLFLVFSMIWVSFTSAASKEHSLVYEIECVNSKGLRLMISNQSHRSIAINKRFSTAGKHDRGEGYFDIYNAAGKRFDFLSRVRLVGVSDYDDRVVLSPYSFVGRWDSFKSITISYNLPPGEYTVTGYYRYVFLYQNIEQAKKETGIDYLSSDGPDSYLNSSEEDSVKVYKILWPQDDVVLVSNTVKIVVDDKREISCSNN